MPGLLFSGDLRDIWLSLKCFPDDSNELANAIIDLLENPKKCDDLGLAGFKLIHEICNSDVMSLNYLKIYQKILKNHI